MDVTGSESWLTAGFLICSVVYFSNTMAGKIPSVKTRNQWNTGVKFCIGPEFLKYLCTLLFGIFNRQIMDSTKQER